MIELRKYQIETIEAARQELRNGKKRIIIQASCGSGKTILAADIVSSALEKDKKVLFLVHYRELAYQALERFQQYGIGDFCGLIMAGEDSKLNLPIQIASVQTYQRRLNFDEPESNQWFHNADLIIYDECFVLGTLIDGKPIESLNVGDKVYSYNSETGKIEKKRITKTFSSAPKSLCKVSIKDGRYIICTESHPVYSEGKYLTATSLLCDSAVGCIQEYRIKGEKNNEISENREMQNVRSRSAVFRGEAFPNIFISVKEGFGLLFRGLFEHNEKRTSQKVRKNACRNKQKGSFLTDEDKQPNGRPKKHRKDEGDKKSQRDIKYLPFSSWWKRTASSDSSTNDGGGFGMGYRTSDKHERPKYIKPLHKDSKILQGGHWKSKIKNWNRNRRSFSCRKKEGVGQEERQVLGTLRVESVEIYKQTSDGKFGGMCQDGYVYNIEVEDNNNYFANGVLVHNCHSSIAKTRKGILQMYIDKNKTILGLTATPCRSDGRGLGEIYEAIIPAIGISALTKQEYLVPCVYYGAKELPDLENIPIVAGDYNKKALGERVDKVKLVGDIYDNWARLAIDRQTVIFATNVNHSKHIKELFQKRGVSCEHIDSHTPDEDRRDIYDNFRDGNIQVLTNCAILGEGVDFPWVSCVVLAKPSKSYARFVQMAGRGLRPHPGKAECLILDHSGLVFRHGFLDDEVCWSLDGKKIAWKKTTRKKEKKILDCEICGTLFSGNRCTQCGHEIKNYGKRIETTDDDLHEIGKNKKKDKELTTEEKKMWYQMIKGEQRRLGKNEKWLLAKYKSRTGVWPRNMDGLMPLSANDDVKKWLTYERIKWIKGKQKMEQAA